MTTVPSGAAAPQQRASTWHVLDNNLVVVDGWDAETGSKVYHQIQARHRLEPDDVRDFEKKSGERMEQFNSRWGLVALIGPKLRALALIAIPVGLGLAQLDATASVGSWLFWVGIPLAVVLTVVLRVAVWRMERTVRALQHESGLVPGMIDEIDQAEAARLLEAHGTRFTVQQASA